MENPFNLLEQRLSHIEKILLNIEQVYSKPKKNIYEDYIGNSPNDLLSVAEVASLIHVKETTIYSYNTKGSIPIFSSETPIIYKRDEIFEWLANNKKLTPRLIKLMEERRIIKK
jgi:predicted DNA-binding transcriptional regulator AlpA